MAPKDVARWLAPVSALAVVMASCGSSGSKSASSGSSVPLAACPFSGTTGATQGTGGPTGAVSKVTTSKSGCIDNIAFSFSTLPPSWTAAYANGPFVDASTGGSVNVPGPVTLVVTFANTTYSGNKTPTTVPPQALQYVTSINVITGPNGSSEWIMSLGEQAQYLTSVSNVPANFTLAIG